MIVFIAIILTLSGGGFIFFEQKQFGKLPSGKRLERIKQSPNYKNGSFQNLSHTPDLAEDANMFKIMKAFLFNREEREPSKTLPYVQIDLKEPADSEPEIIWFGHSSYLIKVEGKTLLVDPVFSGNASPVSFFAKSFKGSNAYQIDDFPKIDYVLITHDHYDHLDYESILKLKNRGIQFFTSLGVGEHLAYWGINEKDITEFDWWQQIPVDANIKLTAAPARHFSGRKFKRNQSLWSSFILETPNKKIYLGGDSGYDTHFKTIGEKYGPFDLALLECGQYNAWWPYIHMMPEQTVQAAIDLNTKVLMPVHWSKFTLALHNWNEPIKRVTALAKKNGVKLTTPMIGEPVNVGSHYPDSVWWEF